jgi:two-component system KDP operon response regulator KdpE
VGDTGPRILVVDDEPAIRRFLHNLLPSRGYVSSEVESGQEALAAARSERPDAIILDLGLPDLDGIEVTRQLRALTPVPIIILSVRDREQDKIAALDAGADDYLTKPFSTQELFARLRATLRRVARPGVDSVLSNDRLRVDLTRRVVTVDGARVQLTPTEYDLLKLLAINAGRVLTHRQILRQVWGEGHEQELHMLRVNISNLRRKIEPDPLRPCFILTELGVGYRLADASEQAPEREGARAASNAENAAAQPGPLFLKTRVSQDAGIRDPGSEEHFTFRIPRDEI